MYCLLERQKAFATSLNADQIKGVLPALLRSHWGSRTMILFESVPPPSLFLSNTEEELGNAPLH